MNDSGGLLAILLIVGRIASWVISGTTAWNWIEPESFGGAILFLIAWGVLGKIFDFIAVAIFAGLAGGLK